MSPAQAAMQYYKVKTIGPAQPVLTQSMPETLDREDALSRAGVIEPPYSPDWMVAMMEDSSSLPQNIAAMEINIDGYGYRLVPTIDPTSETAKVKARQDMYLRARAQGTPLKQRPSDAEVDAYLESLSFDMEMQQAYILSFLQECGGRISLTKLRRLTRREVETTGNGYWEVLRDPVSKQIQGFVMLPTISMRLTEVDREPTRSIRPYRVSDTLVGKKEILTYYRRYVQEYMGRLRYFKEFGDPRTIDPDTGMVVDANTPIEENKEYAHEVIHFQVESLRSPYGIPRWVGVMFGVLGNLAAEQVNHDYFDNNTVGPMALLISGAHVTQDTIKTIREDLKEMKKGRDKAHDIMILAAESNPQPGFQTPQIKMELKTLTGAQLQDGQFLGYIKDNKDSVGTAFRQPRIMTGIVEGANRAGNDAALRFSEQQIYQPERDEFDDFMNRIILLDLGFTLWKFVSNSPLASDPQTMATIVQGLTSSGVLTPKESRRQAGQILNTELENITEPWVKQPLTLTLAQLSQAKKVPAVNTTPGNAEQLRTQKPVGGPKPDGSEALEGIQKPIEVGSGETPVPL
jgi:capsid portal protein